MKKIFAVFIAVVTIVSFATVNINSTNGGALSLSAESAVLIDMESRNLLFSKNHECKMGMASTTKIMTALIAAENYDVKKTVTVSRDAVGIEGSSVYLYEGENITMEELLYCLLLQSANDAAAAIAIAVAGSIEAFAEMMNKRAAEMGLENTHFENPHGLSHEDHYTTAYDLAVISAFALENEMISKIASTYKQSIPIDSDCNPRVLVNHNKMLKLYDGAVGLKTGFTKKTGRCLVSAARRDGLTVIAVTLNAPDDWNDHTKMLDYGFENYESLLIARPGEFVYPMPIVGGADKHITLTNSDELRMTVPKVRRELTYRIETFHRFEFAPILKGTHSGEIFYSYDEKFFCRSRLVCAQSVTSAQENNTSFWNKIFN